MLVDRCPSCDIITVTKESVSRLPSKPLLSSLGRGTQASAAAAHLLPVLTEAALVTVAVVTLPTVTTEIFLIGSRPTRLLPRHPSWASLLAMPAVVGDCPGVLVHDPEARRRDAAAERP